MEQLYQNQPSDDWSKRMDFHWLRNDPINNKTCKAQWHEANKCEQHAFKHAEKTKCHTGRSTMDPRTQLFLNAKTPYGNIPQQHCIGGPSDVEGGHQVRHGVPSQWGKSVDRKASKCPKSDICPKFPRNSPRSGKITISIYIYYYILYLRFATMRWTKSWHNDSLPVAQPLQVPVFNKGWPYLATDQPALGFFFLGSHSESNSLHFQHGIPSP